MALIPLLVGETNPYGPSEDFALYPDPVNSAGWRLCFRVLGFKTSQDYFEKFDRTNLCAFGWRIKKAREKAVQLSAERETPLILLGRQVCDAFGVAFEPFTAQTSLLGPNRTRYILPHPSGRCRAWNDPESITKARELLKEFL